MKTYFFEAIGTFFLVCTIALTGDPVAIGVVLASLVYAGASISGAHYNPAVTYALFHRKKISLETAKMYILFQFIGSTVACLVIHFVFGKLFTVAPSTHVSWTASLFAEFLFTFLLVTVILHVAASKKTSGNDYFGMAIGGVVLVGAKAVGGVSGGAFNPAVGITPLIVNYLLGVHSFDPALFFLYSIGPICGALAASMIHEYTQR